MIRGAVGNFGFGLRPDDVAVKPHGSVAADGANGPLQIAVEFSNDVLDKIAPRLGAEKASPRDDTNLRKFVQTMGETARRLGPENGWPERRVQVMELSTQASWSG
jgi:hypothetical protein